MQNFGFVIDELKQLVQQAECIPPEQRALSWSLLLGILPLERAQWPPTLRRQRTEYYKIVIQHFVPEKEEGAVYHCFSSFLRNFSCF